MQVWRMRTGISITLKPVDRRRLTTVAGDRNAPHKHVWRAEIVLLSADGVGTNEIMRRTGKSKTCVWRWQERFMQAGYDGLLRDKTRPSRIPPLGSDIAKRVVALTRTDPPAEATHWTATMMAKAVGISASSVQRIWRTHGLQPHRVHQFKLSNDPKFIDKLRDVVGLYVDPPAHAIVLSVDEKSQIQALDRTQPGLPMKKGRAGTMTHDYKRHGTTTLFAALDVLEGKVIGRCMQRHRHQEFIRFLNAIDAQVPAKKSVHVILDNYAAHKHPKVRQWLDRHPRFTFHFTPTSCSWLNAVEGFERWQKRDLSARRYVYVWADGVFLQARMEDHGECMLVLIGATPEGKKELIGFQVGVRESAQSWRELLVEVKSRGLTIAPEIAVGDGALGFWKALDEVFPGTRHQRCWVHKTANVLNKVTLSVQTNMKKDLREIYLAPNRASAEVAINVFAEKYGAKYDKAVECLTKDREALLALYEFPAEHWDHLRTTNPIESVFATVRHRTVRTKGSLSPTTARLMVFKLLCAASKTWRRLKSTNQLPKVIAGVRFENGIEVSQVPANHAA